MKLDLAKPNVIAWLSQFGSHDESLARNLLDHIRVVSADEFQSKLIGLIEERHADGAAPVGLYAERSVRTYRDVPNRLFREQKGKIRRAIGGGPQPVLPMHYGKHETGSEGLIATLITSLTRKHHARFLDHPGPNAIRKKRVRRFFLVADFIGTGQRATRYLDAAWRSASVRSWVSGKFLAFEVICFSATQEGIARIEAHPCHPKVYQVEAPPTLEAFTPFEGRRLIQLCRDYGPRDSETSIPPLGYGDVGALIAFAHGMPNNAPRLLFVKGKKWAPLFAARVTGADVGLSGNSEEIVRARLRRLRETRLAQFELRRYRDLEKYISPLVLSALKRRPRTAEVVSSRTGLSVSEVWAVLERVRAAGWIDQNNRLLPKAWAELRYLRKQGAYKRDIGLPAKSIYVPKDLRAPK